MLVWPVQKEALPHGTVPSSSNIALRSLGIQGLGIQRAISGAGGIGELLYSAMEWSQGHRES